MRPPHHHHAHSSNLWPSIHYGQTETREKVAATVIQQPRDWEQDIPKQLEGGDLCCCALMWGPPQNGPVLSANLVIFSASRSSPIIGSVRGAAKWPSVRNLLRERTRKRPRALHTLIFGACARAFFTVSFLRSVGSPIRAGSAPRSATVPRACWAACLRPSRCYPSSLPIPHIPGSSHLSRYLSHGQHVGQQRHLVDAWYKSTLAFGYIFFCLCLCVSINQSTFHWIQSLSTG